MSHDKKPIDPIAVLQRLEIFSELHPDISFDQALFEIIWHLETCDEAVALFEEGFYICPVCFEHVNNDGVLVHKSKKDIVQ